MQVGQHLRARSNQESQRDKNGIQVHGEHFSVLGGCQVIRRASARDLPECRLMGETKLELGGDLPSVVGQKGKKIAEKSSKMLKNFSF